MEKRGYTRRDQWRFAYRLLEGMGTLGDTTQLPEAVQLANEDRIRAGCGKITIDERFRDKYREALEKPITEGEYYLVETLTADKIIEKASKI